jgi:hypothetical protein
MQAWLRRTVQPLVTMLDVAVKPMVTRWFHQAYYRAPNSWTQNSSSQYKMRANLCR